MRLTVFCFLTKRGGGGEGGGCGQVRTGASHFLDEDGINRTLGLLAGCLVYTTVSQSIHVTL